MFEETEELPSTYKYCHFIHGRHVSDRLGRNVTSAYLGFPPWHSPVTIWNWTSEMRGKFSSQHRKA
jgi:hypothetical protein